MVAETKLYDALSIQPSASDIDIKKAYRKAALKWHPDKNKDDPKAADKFKEVSQAYEILSDPEKRKTYDQYGLDFLLKGGHPMPEGASPGGAGFGGAGMPGGFGGVPGGFGGMPGGMPGGTTFSFSTGGSPFGGRGGFTPGNANSIFEQFVGSGGGRMGDDDDDVFASLFNRGGGLGGMGGMGGRSFSGMNGMPQRQSAPEVTIVERPLRVSLEDLFKGTHKKLQITRKTYDPQTGKRSKETKVLEVPIKAGLKAGSKIKFSGVGDETEGGSQDLHFIVEELPHDRFKRDGDNLKQTLDIELKDSLLGWSKTVTTIDGKQLSISAGGPTGPTYSQTFPQQGMPKSKFPGQRGDLVVGINIKYPKSLTADQKTKLKDIL